MPKTFRQAAHVGLERSFKHSKQMEKHMTIKPSIQFLNYDSDALSVTKAGGIVTGLTDNPHYLTPSPGPGSGADGAG
jgi:hypothetical protein